jgi:hypothetical protein
MTAPAAALSELQLFVEASASPVVSFNGTEIASPSPGYRRIELPGYGNISFDGSGSLTAVVLAYSQNRSSGSPEGTRFSASAFATGNGTREVTVEAWRR